MGLASSIALAVGVVSRSHRRRRRLRVRLSIIFLSVCSDLHGGKFNAVSEELPEQAALHLNRLVLFDDQQRQQTVGDQKQNRKERKHAALRLR